MKSPFGLRLLAAVAAPLMFMSAACGSGGAANSSDSQSSTSSPNNESSNEKVKDEELDGALVTSFPAEIPLYDGEVEKSLGQMSEITEQPEWNVTITTTDDLTDVDTSIRQAYSENGWTIVSDNEFAGGYQLTARGNGYTVSITHNDFGSSTVTINYGVSKTS